MTTEKKVKCNFCKRKRFISKVRKTYVEDLKNWTKAGYVFICDDIDCVNVPNLPKED